MKLTPRHLAAAAAAIAALGVGGLATVAGAQDTPTTTVPDSGVENDGGVEDDTGLENDRLHREDCDRGDSSGDAVGDATEAPATPTAV